jgi:hypothetical protein
MLFIKGSGLKKAMTAEFREYQRRSSPMQASFYVHGKAGIG